MMPVYRNSWLPEVFNDLFVNAPKTNATAPAINVKETEDSYIVELAAAGMRKEDFMVHINDDGDLTIKMENKREDKEEDKKLIICVASFLTLSSSRPLSCRMM